MQAVLCPHFNSRQCVWGCGGATATRNWPACLDGMPIGVNKKQFGLVQTRSHTKPQALHAPLCAAKPAGQVRQNAAVKPHARSLVLSRAAPKKKVEAAPVAEEMDTGGLAVIAAGIASNPIMLFSLWAVKETGEGLPPGPGGSVGLAGVLAGHKVYAGFNQSCLIHGFCGPCIPVFSRGF